MPSYRPSSTCGSPKARAPVRKLACGLGGVLGLAGCIDTDAAVFVEASIESASVAVSSNGFAAGVDGALSLRLHLGPRASGSSEVDDRGFSILRTGGTTTLVPSLGYVADPPFPVTVAVDSTLLIAVTFAKEDNAFDPTAVAELCDPAGLVLRGVLDDALRGGAISADSEPVTPTGCP
jgi:hypothetical protein